MNSEEEVLLQKGKEVFQKRYGRVPKKAARAPGRVNLIGDHVDYCDGFVLPVVSICISLEVIFDMFCYI